MSGSPWLSIACNIDLFFGTILRVDIITAIIEN